MSNLFLNLPVPASTGPGAAVDTSRLGKSKTVIIGGSFKGTVLIEYATDAAGTDFAPLPMANFSAPGRLTFDLAAHWMRAVMSGSGAANADVGGSNVGSLFVQLGPVAVDISSLPEFKTVVADGPCKVEISEDGVTYSETFDFQVAGGQSAPVYGQFARVTGGATVWMGGADVGDGDDSSLTLNMIIFRPSDPLGSHDNVYVTWAETYAALQQIQGLGATLQFDNTFVPPPDVFGDPFAPGPCRIPAGVWNMDRVTLMNVQQGGHTDVLFEDGAKFTTSDPNICMRIIGYGLYFISNRVGPVAPFTDVGFLISGNNVRFFNTEPTALPMIEVGPSGFVLMLWDGSNRFSGVGSDFFPFVDHGPIFPSPAPIVDCNGGFIFYAGGGGFIANNAFTDLSLGGGGGVGMGISAHEMFGDPFEPFFFPALLANGGFFFIQVQTPHNRHNIFPTVSAATLAADTVSGVGDSFAVSDGVVTLTDAAGLFVEAMLGKSLVIAGSTNPLNDGNFVVTNFISATQIQFNNAAGVAEVFPGTWDIGSLYPAYCNEFIRVDTAGIVPVTVLAPRAVLSPGERFTVKDVGGNATANPVVVSPTGGDTIESGTVAANDGCRTWTSDGEGFWWLTAEA